MNAVLKRALEALVIIGVFATAGVVGAVLWRLVVHLPRFTRSADGVHMDAVQITRMLPIDGWFALIAGALGFVLGLVVMLIRPARPYFAVVVIAAGAGIAAAVMVTVGRWIGPDSAAHQFAHTAVGASFPTPLKLHATGVEFFFPGLALLGALLVLLIVPGRDVVSASPSDVRGNDDQRAGADSAH